MSSPLKQNTISLQSLLDEVNNLPGNGEAQENLDAELNAQAILLEEQNTKIAQLNDILIHKANRNIETCIGTIESGGGFETSKEILVYLDKNLNYQIIQSESSQGYPDSIEVIKNSIIFSSRTYESKDNNLLNLFTTSDYDDGKVFNAGCVLDDFTIYI